MKISQNVKQDTSSSENSSQTVEMKESNETKQMKESNVKNKTYLTK